MLSLIDFKQNLGVEDLSFSNFFIPELVLITIISYILLVISFELGDKNTMASLSLRSLKTFKTGFIFIAVLYVFEYIFAPNAILFNGYLINNSYIVALKITTLLAGLFILSNSQLYIQQRTRSSLEYPLIIALAVLFMVLLVGAGHFISAFLALIGFSLNLYILILFDAPTAVAREAGIKYFYLSAFSSGLMLYGIFLLFLVTGTGHLSEINFALAARADIPGFLSLLSCGVIFLLIGLFFKLSAFPGHL